MDRRARGTASIPVGLVERYLSEAEADVAECHEILVDAPAGVRDGSGGAALASGAGVSTHSTRRLAVPTELGTFNGG